MRVSKAEWDVQNGVGSIEGFLCWHNGFVRKQYLNDTMNQAIFTGLVMEKCLFQFKFSIKF